jgi:hypothetical protein
VGGCRQQQKENTSSYCSYFDGLCLFSYVFYLNNSFLRSVIFHNNVNFIWGTYLERIEAVALLKELASLNLVIPSIVSIDKNKEGTFSLTIKTNSNLLGIRAFLADKNLILFEDTEKGTCTIYTP